MDDQTVSGPLSQMPGAQNSTDHNQADVAADTPQQSVDDYMPPTDTVSSEEADQADSSAPTTVAAMEHTTSVSDQPTTASSDESLENQNIFDMLGVRESTEAEREAFLDELQEVIWEDFLDRDVALLITDEEKQELEKIKAEHPGTTAESKEAIASYLEKLIPDLEEVMLEKALELKEDLFKERIADMRDYFVGKQTELDTISKAETQMGQQQWATATQTLNSLKP